MSGRKMTVFDHGMPILIERTTLDENKLEKH